MTASVEERLYAAHGDGVCRCGYHYVARGHPHCNYPHGLLPIYPVDPTRTTGFYVWELPPRPSWPEGLPRPIS